MTILFSYLERGVGVGLGGVGRGVRVPVLYRQTLTVLVFKTTENRFRFFAPFYWAKMSGVLTVMRCFTLLQLKCPADAGIHL